MAVVEHHFRPQRLTALSWLGDPAYPTMRNYSGMAYAAKLAFFDIGVTNTPYLDVPSLNEVVFPAASSAGAHIHSNSWGAGYSACDETCYQLDEYTYANPVSHGHARRRANVLGRVL